MTTPDFAESRTELAFREHVARKMHDAGRLDDDQYDSQLRIIQVERDWLSEVEQIDFIFNRREHA